MSNNRYSYRLGIFANTCFAECLNPSGKKESFYKIIHSLVQGFWHSAQVSDIEFITAHPADGDEVHKSSLH